MKSINLRVDHVELLLNKMDVIITELSKNRKVEDPFIDNQEFLQLMNISKRTAQTWRDEGIISFSQVGSKIYYRMSDVQKLLDSNYNKAIKR